MKFQIFFLASLISVCAFAQEQEAKAPAAPAFILKGTFGMIANARLSFTDSEWQRMTPDLAVPESFQVNPNGTDYFKKAIENDYWMLSFSFVNHQYKAVEKKYRFTTTIHVGLGPESIANKYWFRENRQVIDTLYSNQSGNVYPVIGNRRQDLQKSYRIKSQMIGIGQHFATNPEGILQFETGLDVFFAYATANVMSYSNDRYLIEGADPATYNYQAPADLAGAQTAEHKAKTTRGLIIRIPLEISIPLSRKNAVLKRMRLGCELNTGLTIWFTKGKTNYSLYSNSGLNFRYEFYRFKSPFRSKSQKQASN